MKLRNTTWTVAEIRYISFDDLKSSLDNFNSVEWSAEQREVLIELYQVVLFKTTDQ